MFSFRATLPGARRVAEVDLDVAVDREAGVLGHLLSLIPGQRAAERLGQSLDALGERVPHGLGGAPAGELDQHREAGLTLNERRDRGAAGLPDDQVALPVAGDGAVVDLRGPLADRDDLAQVAAQPCASGTTLRTARAQASASSAPQTHRATARTATGRSSRATRASPDRRGSPREASQRSAAATSPPPAASSDLGSQPCTARASPASDGAPARAPAPPPAQRGSHGGRRCAQLPGHRRRPPDPAAARSRQRARPGDSKRDLLPLSKREPQSSSEPRTGRTPPVRTTQRIDRPRITTNRRSDLLPRLTSRDPPLPSPLAPPDSTACRNHPALAFHL